MDSTITLGGPAAIYAQDASGRIYGVGTRRSGLLEWARDGRLVRVVAKVGEGPGEISAGIGVPFITQGDTLYLRDGVGRWIVFDSSRRFLRTASLGRSSVAGDKSTSFIGGNQLLSTAQVQFNDPDSAWYDITITDRNGNILKRFSPLKRFSIVDVASGRPSASAGDGTFWIGPHPGPEHGFRIERWDTAGNRLRVVEQTSSLHSTPDYFGLGDKLPKVPSVSRLTLDGQGFLWVISSSPSKFWTKRNAETATALPPGQRKDSLLRMMVNMQLDVFTEDSGVHVASLAISPEEPAFASMLAGSRRVYRFVTDSLGDRLPQFFSLTLQNESGSRCTTNSSGVPNR